MTVRDLVPILDDELSKLADRVVKRVVVRDYAWWWREPPIEWQRLEVDLEPTRTGPEKIVAGRFKKGAVWVCAEREQ